MAIQDGLIIKIINVLVFAFTFGSSTYNSTLGWSKETYITPAAYALWVWSLIHLLLLGFVVYQFFDKGKEVIVDKIQWRFALVGLLSAAATWFQIRGWHITTFIVSILVSAAVSTIYYIIRVNHRATLPDELFIHLPFSLYHAWALVLVVLSGFDAFGRDISHHAGVGTKVFVFLALLFLETSAVGYAWSSREGDVGGAAVITWTLWAIFSHQTKSSFIHWSALAFAILASLNVIKAFVTTWRGGGAMAVLHDEERAPLVGN